MKILALIIASIFSIFGVYKIWDNETYTEWTIENNSQNQNEISWMKFKWIDKELNGRQFYKTAMFIPCKVEGIPNVVTFQFDLGADLSGVYEKNFSSFYNLNPNLKASVKKIAFRNKKYHENLKIQFGDYIATTKSSFIYSNYGEVVEDFKPTDTIHLGTIGADMFKEKVLIIDYPNQKFAICDKIPEKYNNPFFCDIKLDGRNRALLPMTLKNKNYKVLFDNGSSMFPLLINAENISEFTQSEDIDTIQSSSFGIIHNVTGKQLNENFTLGGQNFIGTTIYSDHRKKQAKNEWDLIAGNVLFWDKTIIIDFKNKKFGVN